MLTLEPLEPLRIRVHGEIRDLVPGVPIELTEEQGRRLLAKAPGRVRLVAEGGVRLTVEPAFQPNPDALIGQVIQWESPSFGLLSGLVVAETGGMVTVQHPLTEKEATFPKGWIVGRRE